MSRICTLMDQRTVLTRLAAAGSLALALLLPAAPAAAADQAPPVGFKQSPGKVAITVGDQPFADYVYEDKDITRPYFAHVRAPGGAQVTRNHPPVEGKDLTDHPTFHPGIWLAFGDISGSDYWRIKAPVKHVDFIAPPTGGPGRGAFAVRNSYRDQNQPEKQICQQDCKYDVRVVPGGYMLLWDSEFSSDHQFYFGDQEEMGLGFRLATPLRVEQSTEGGLPAGTGEIVDSEGRRDEEQVWGNSAQWCDASGVIDGERLGIAIFCHPKNFRPSWFHARDYGLLEANPFGRAAFGKGEPSKVVVKPGESLRLRYGVFVHANPEGQRPDLPAAYRTYLELAGK